MSTIPTRPPDDKATNALSGGLSLSNATHSLTLGSLPVGARLVLRCRKDWRAATIAAHEREAARVVLSVVSPSGHTYRLRRPPDSELSLDGHIPVLGAGQWRVGLVRYDARW